MNKKGFSLMESLVVLAVMVILIGVAIVGYGLIVDKASAQVCETNLVNMENFYRVEHQLDPSVSREDIVNNWSDYFDSEAGCPSGGTYYCRTTCSIAPSMMKIHRNSTVIFSPKKRA